ncbi:MAG: penicillin-binding protein activator [Gemmobacter sp.]
MHDQGITRRALIGSALAASVLAGCGAQTGGRSLSTQGADGRQAALLLPLTGAQGAVGQNMARAAGLAAGGQGGPPVFDTGDTAEGAAAAARAALDGGAKLLLGPLRSDQTPAVLAVAGNVPVVTFSNDDTLAGQGAFVMGITPAQSVATMFSYARAQGLTRIAVVAADTPLGAATATAARAIGAAGGIEVTAVLLRDPGAGGLVATLRAEGGLPQAVFLPDGGRALAGFARGLAGSGVQLLGSVQWGVTDPGADANLSGAWFAAPPPDLFLPFADRFQAAHGEAPGVVAGLGHDAALLAMGLAQAKSLTRRGLTRKAGFTGVLGPFRFRDDGRCQRDLAVLTLDAGTLSVLAEVSGT